jgi:23S rRNA (guanine1835-N2)-methyltransferase
VVAVSDAQHSGSARRSLTGDCDELALAARVDGAADEYRFQTVDGVCSKQSFRTAELLLADALWDEAIDEVLVPEANYGVVGVLLDASCERVVMTEASARAAHLCEANAAANGVGADVSVATGISRLDEQSTSARAGDAGTRPDRGQSFDAVAVAPKPYAPLDVTAQRIVDAGSRLTAGGRVYLAAAEQSGLNRYRGVLAEIASEVAQIAERGDHTVLAARVHSERARNVSAFVKSRVFEERVGGVDLSLVSVPGVFSAGGIDDGTRLLAAAATVDDGDRVLDLCCGYGALGAYAASVADCEVVLSDENRLATACAERTLEMTGVATAVVTADSASGVGGERFDRILCNPPTHATDSVLCDLFDDAREVLANDGHLFVVHHRDLDLRPQLAAFDDVETASTGPDHVVLLAR